MRGTKHGGARNPIRANSHLTPMKDEPWRLCTRCYCRDCDDRLFFCRLRQWRDRQRIDQAQDLDVRWLVPKMARVEVRDEQRQ